MSIEKRPLIAIATFEVRPRADTTTVGVTDSYIKAVRKAGGIPIMLPMIMDKDEMTAVLDIANGILIPGGGDISPERYGGTHHDKIYGINLERDEFEINLVQYAMQRQKPTFAICRGLQVMNVALGGTLWEDVQDLMPEGMKHAYFGEQPRNYVAHTVDVAPDSCLAYYLQSTTASVNSLHHQGLKELAAEVKATAVSPDGLIEAIEVPGHPFAMGVQWHPENLVDDDPAMLRLFEGLIQASSN